MTTNPKPSLKEMFDTLQTIELQLSILENNKTELLRIIEQYILQPEIGLSGVILDDNIVDALTGEKISVPFKYSQKRTTKFNPEKAMKDNIIVESCFKTVLKTKKEIQLALKEQEINDADIEKYFDIEEYSEPKLKLIKLK